MNDISWTYIGLLVALNYTGINIAFKLDKIISLLKEKK